MKLDIDFFTIDNTVKPQKGSILLSEPLLQDMYFKRSVVLVTEHSEKGTVGFVLNKPVNVKLSKLIKGLPNLDIPISLGGPIETNSVHYLHTVGDLLPDSVEISKGIYWGGDFETMKLRVLSGEIKTNQIIFLVGYSGWQPQQLESELDRNCWIVTELKNQKQFNSLYQVDSWKNLLITFGEKYKLWLNIPDDPSMN